MKRFFMMITVFAILGILFFLPENTVCAQATDTSDMNREKYFTTYVVEQDDTLWDIAEQYLSAEYDSIYIYIDEVMKTNHLESTSIIDGQLLLLPYYADAHGIK